MRLAEKNKCSGCGLCAVVCPKGALSMQADGEGFLYPFLESSLCIDCGLCEKKCPVLASLDIRTPLAVYAAVNYDDAVRGASSSGGVFSLLAKQLLDKGGIVFGAGWDEQWRVVHKAAENETQLDELRGSKYVQSKMGDTFHQVVEQASKGRQVLYSGTPCQIAALRSYLSGHDECSNQIIFVEVVCHAAPSPAVWAAYIKWCGQQYSAQVKTISFRDKTQGWRKFSMRMGFSDGQIYSRTLAEDPFLRGFLSEMFNRLSCAQCHFRNLRSGADISLADYWGIGKIFPDMDDNRGASLVLVHTEKGSAAWECIASRLTVRESTYADACEKNTAIHTSPAISEKREEFFQRWRNEENLGAWITRCTEESWALRVANERKRRKRVEHLAKARRVVRWRMVWLARILLRFR